jgi:hypothetical protein
MPGGTIRLYRGEGAGNTQIGGWFTTDPAKAALYGKVSHIDVTRDDLRRFAQGHGGPDEWVTNDPVILNRPRTASEPPPGSAAAGDPFDPGSMFGDRLAAAGGAGGKPPKPPSGPPGEPPTMQPPPGGPQQARRGAEAAADAIRDLFWTKGWRERKAGRDTAKAILREQVGTARQRKAQAVAALENFRATSSAMVPDFERWIGEVHAGRDGPLPPAMALINHVEGRGYLPKGDPLRPLADELRKVYQRTRDHISSDVEDWDGFVENYYRHLWKEGAAGEPPGWGAGKPARRRR